MTLRLRSWNLAFGLALAACAAAPGVPPAPAAAASLPPLAGTRWVGAAPGIDEPQAKPRLEFAEGGQLHGYTGCNMLSGHWQEEGGEIRFSALVVTKRLCLGPGAGVEEKFLAAFSAQSRAKRTATTLTITSPQGAKFELVPAAAA